MRNKPFDAKGSMFLTVRKKPEWVEESKFGREQSEMEFKKG